MRTKNNTLLILLAMMAILICGVLFLLNDPGDSAEKEDTVSENTESDEKDTGNPSNKEDIVSENTESDKKEAGDNTVQNNEAQVTAESEQDANTPRESTENEEKPQTNETTPNGDDKESQSQETDIWADNPESEPANDNSTSQTHYVSPTALPDQYYYFGGHTYGFYDASRYGYQTYLQVADFCEDQGGHLAVINSQEENNYLFNLVRQNYDKTVFFGYSDELEEGNWQWAYGNSTYENFTTYGEWDLPDNGYKYGGDEDYAEFNYERGKQGIPNDGTWNDAPFRDNTDIFVCEWEYELD